MKWTLQTVYGFMKDAMSLFQKNFFTGYKKRPLFRVAFFDVWLREPDLNRRPSGYEPDELPDCSIPRLWAAFYSQAAGCQPLIN
jgi:hypothetical protein